jgi:hypothetical protein
MLIGTLRAKDYIIQVSMYHAADMQLTLSGHQVQVWAKFTVRFQFRQHEFTTKLKPHVFAVLNSDKHYSWLMKIHFG